MVRIRHHKVKEVRIQCDLSPGRQVACNCPPQGRRSVRAARAVRNGRVFLTDSRVIADAGRGENCGTLSGEDPLESSFSSLTCEYWSTRMDGSSQSGLGYMAGSLTVSGRTYNPSDQKIRVSTPVSNFCWSYNCLESSTRFSMFFKTNE